MAQKAAKQRQTSLCEKSMEIVVNLIKVSSFSIASINLGANSSSKHGKNNNKQVVVKAQPSGVAAASSGGGHAGNNHNKRLLKGPEGSKRQTFVMEQDGGGKSWYMVCESNEKYEEGDDGNFSDYIKEVHKRNGKGSSSNNKVSRDITAITNGKVDNFIRRFHERNHNILMSASTSLPYTPIPAPPSY